MAEFRTIPLGPGPSDEQLADPQGDHYYVKCNLEMTRWINTLKHHFGEPPTGAFFAVLNHETDFGNVREVAVKYDPNNLRAADYAFRVEREAPSRWLEEVKR